MLANNWPFFYIKLHNYVQPGNKKTRYTKGSNNTKTRPSSHLRIKKAKQKCKNPNKIEKWYIQLRLPDHSKVDKIKEKK